jgi:predicted ribosomally synthesized peptide with SipW-like signal peptide
MSKKRIKQYLMLLTVIGLVSVAAGSGTFASFSAETTNPGNTFAAGTLFLHNTKGATTCTSESATTGPFNVNPGDGTNGDTCATLFTADLSAGAATAHLALNNAGSIDTSDLKFKVGSCTFGDNFANTGSHATFVSPTDCSGMYLTIQETDNTYGVPGTDVYCAFGPSGTQPDCDAPDNTATLDDATGLTDLQTTGGIPATLTSNQTRYYVITIDPSGVGTGNALQNLSVSFDLTWHIDQ